MAPSFDSAVSSLLCAEENSSFLDESEFGDIEEEYDEKFVTIPYFHRSRRPRHRQENGFIPLFPALQCDACLASTVEREYQHLPADNYLERLKTGALDSRARIEAADWIAKVHAHFNFGPLSACLSINYLDRFLSLYELPKGKAWTMQLLAVACLSLAAKMEETNVPFPLDLQLGESNFVFETRAIQRMELLVLSTLQWRMQSVTPFSFLDYFLHKFNCDEKLLNAAIIPSIQLILSTIKGIQFLEFKPSEIAAAVALSVARETHMITNTEEATSGLTQHVQKERMLKCVDMIDDFALMNGGTVKGVSIVSGLSLPPSPFGVLDAACLSYKSDDTSVGSTASSSSPGGQNCKRRKLNISL